MNWYDDFAETVRRNVPLGPLTWFKIGGAARWLVEPHGEAMLSVVLARCRDAGIDVRFLGRGANLLIADDGVNAAVVRLRGPAFESVTFDGPNVTAAAGADLMELVKETARRGLSGLEALAGIPATVGGGVRMNCGGHSGRIGDHVTRVRVIAPDGSIRLRDDVRFGYRCTDLGEDRVLAVTFHLTPADPAQVCRRYVTIWREKMASQPSPAQRTAGCIFRNPPGDAAGAVIDRCGLKGTRRGGAVVSRRHANFIVAGSGATAADVLDLIDVIRDRVRDHCGVYLEPEIDLWTDGVAAHDRRDDGRNAMP